MKVDIIGDAVVITSAIKMEDLKTVEKFSPETLVLKDEHGNELFRVTASSDEGGETFSKYGAIFAGASRDENGYATTTFRFVCDAGVEETKKAFAEMYAIPLTNLAKIETAVTAKVREVNANIAEIASKISVQ